MSTSFLSPFEFPDAAPTGADLTASSDTNVTLALGGTPTGALLNAVSITASWTGTLAAGRLNSNVVQGVTNDTNVTGSIAAQNLTLAWTGTLAAARLNADVVQAITNDTNVTGSIAAQNLTLGWTGTLASGRLNSNVVQSVVNDTNVTGSISAQALTLGWTGTLALSRLAQGTDGQIIVGQTSASPLYKTLSGDATLSAAGAMTLANSGVTAGSYTSANITVDAKGRVTAAASAAVGGVVGPSTSFDTVNTGGSNYMLVSGYNGDGDGGDTILKRTPGAAGTEIGYQTDLLGAPWVTIGPQYTPEMAGALNDGTNAAITRAAIQKILDNEGRVYFRKRGGNYAIDASLLITSSGGGIIGDGSQTITMGAGDFNNDGITWADKVGATSAGIYAHGGLSGGYTPLSNLVLRGFKIQNSTTGRRLNVGMALYNLINADVQGIEVANIPLGYGILGGSILRSVIRDCYFHDFLNDNDDWAGAQEIAAIELDDDRINNINSDGVQIVDNRMYKMEVGSNFITAFGYQTDGIKLRHTGIKNIIARGNYIYACGQGIDSFGIDTVIDGNRIDESYYYGIPLKHGALRHVVANNVVTNSGLAGIAIFGATEQSAEGHLIRGNIVTTIDPHARFGASTTFCIGTDNSNSATFQPINNLFQGNRCDSGAGGDYAIVRGGTGSSDYLDNEIAAGSVGYVYVGTETGEFRVARPSKTRASATGSQNVTAGSTDVVTFGAATFDQRSEWDDTNDRWTCQIPGYYEIDAIVRASAITITAGQSCALVIQKNGSNSSSCDDAPLGSPNGFKVYDTLKLAAGDTIRVAFYNGTSNTVTLSGDRFISIKSA